MSGVWDKSEPPPRLQASWWTFAMMAHAWEPELVLDQLVPVLALAAAYVHDAWHRTHSRKMTSLTGDPFSRFFFSHEGTKSLNKAPLPA